MHLNSGEFSYNSARLIHYLSNLLPSGLTHDHRSGFAARGVLR